MRFLIAFFILFIACPIYAIGVLIGAIGCLIISIFQYLKPKIRRFK